MYVQCQCIRRGHNRTVCFCHVDDHRFYLAALQDAAQKYACQIHAYVLMTNHVPFLVTGVQAGAISALMQALGRRYVRYVNTTYRRTGILWEGRFKSSIIESERYWLTCYRYVELNPIVLLAQGGIPEVKSGDFCTVAAQARRSTKGCK